jgi:hypothetical protein
MLRSHHTVSCPDPQSTRVLVYFSPNLCAWDLRRPRRGVGVHPERLGAFSSPLPKSIANAPSRYHPSHSRADASLLCPVALAWHVGPRRTANHLDFSPCSLPEHKESNSRANKALILNNLQTPYLVSLVNSYIYKIGGGVFSGCVNAHQVARAFRRNTPFGARSMSLRFNFQLSTTCPAYPEERWERSRRVNSSSTIPALHSVVPNFTFGAHFTPGDR